MKLLMIQREERLKLANYLAVNKLMSALVLNVIIKPIKKQLY